MDRRIHVVYAATGFAVGALVSWLSGSAGLNPLIQGTLTGLGLTLGAMLGARIRRSRAERRDAA